MPLQIIQFEQCIFKFKFWCAHGTYGHLTPSIHVRKWEMQNEIHDVLVVFCFREVFSSSQEVSGSYACAPIMASFFLVRMFLKDDAFLVNRAHQQQLLRIELAAVSLEKILTHQTSAPMTRMRQATKFSE